MNALRGEAARTAFHSRMPWGLRSIVTLRNWRSVNSAVAKSARSGGTGGVITIRTRRGLTFRCPDDVATSSAVFEVLCLDAYRLRSVKWGDLGPAPRVFDIGAHVGSFSCEMGRLFPDASLTCVEPSPATAGWLRTNLESNGLTSRSSVIEAAVAKERASVVLWQAGYETSVASSVFGRFGDSPVTVDAIRFEDVCEQAGGTPTVVKLDCEGGEHAAVQDSPDWCWRDARHVFLEYHPVEGHSFRNLYERFSDLGFYLMWQECLDGTQVTPWPDGSDHKEFGMAYFAR